MFLVYIQQERVQLMFACRAFVSQSTVLHLQDPPPHKNLVPVQLWLTLKVKCQTQAKRRQELTAHAV
jgi:hypothetical protein